MAPQPEHDGSDVQIELNVEQEHGSDIVANMTKTPRVKYITFYEDSESIPGKGTAVWELDKANHRNVVRSPVLMRELWLQMWHDIQPGAKSNFVTKGNKNNIWLYDHFLLLVGVHANTLSQPSGGHLEMRIATGITGKPIVLGKITVNTVTVLGCSLRTKLKIEEYISANMLLQYIYSSFRSQ